MKRKVIKFANERLAYAKTGIRWIPWSYFIILILGSGKWQRYTKLPPYYPIPIGMFAYAVVPMARSDRMLSLPLHCIVWYVGMRINILFYWLYPLCLAIFMRPDMYLNSIKMDLMDSLRLYRWIARRTIKPILDCLFPDIWVNDPHYLPFWLFGALYALQETSKRGNASVQASKCILLFEGLGNRLQLNRSTAYDAFKAGINGPDSTPISFQSLSRLSRLSSNKKILVTPIMEALVTVYELHYPLNAKQQRLLLNFMGPLYPILPTNPKLLFHTLTERARVAQPSPSEDVAIPLSVQAIFQLPPQASDNCVKQAYHRLMLRYHPDKVSSLQDPQLSEEAERKTQALQETYAFWQQWRTNSAPR